MSMFSGSTEASTRSWVKPVGLLCLEPIAFNPSKAELEKLGINTEKEPIYVNKEYVPKYGDKAGQKVLQLRFSFYFKVVSEIAGYEGDAPIISQNFFVAQNPRAESSKGSYEIINGHGLSTWISKENISESGAVAPDPNRSWYNFLNNPRRTHEGEADLLNFLIDLFQYNRSSKDLDMSGFMSQLFSKHSIEGVRDQFKPKGLTFDANGNRVKMWVLRGMEDRKGDGKYYPVYGKFYRFTDKPDTSRLLKDSNIKPETYNHDTIPHIFEEPSFMPNGSSRNSFKLNTSSASDDNSGMDGWDD